MLGRPQLWAHFSLALQELLSLLEFNLNLQQATQAPGTAHSAGGGQRLPGSPSYDHHFVIPHSLG